MFAKLINWLEVFTLSVGRVLLIFSALAIFVGAVFYVVWTGISAIGDDRPNVKPPLFVSSFQPPNENPIEEVDRRERLKQAKKSFDSSFVDISNQIKLSSKNLRKEYLEITSRYLELSEKPENKINMRKLALISDRMADELSESCRKGELAFKQQFDNINRDIFQVSQKFDVKKDSISNDYLVSLESLVSQNDHCIKQSKLVKAIAKNLKKAYPGDWGLPVRGITSNGSRAKSALELAVGNLYKELERIYEDDQSLNSYFETLSNYTASLAVYYSGIAADLESSNKMTANNAEILAADITNNIVEHSENGLKEYLRFESESKTSIETTYIQRLAIKLGVLFGVSSILFYVLLGILLLIIVFALERHNRNLRSLVNLNKD